MPENNNVTEEVPKVLLEGGSAQSYVTLQVLPSHSEVTAGEVSIVNPSTFVTYAGYPTQDQNNILAQQYVTLPGTLSMNQTTYMPLVGDSLQQPMGLVTPAGDSSQVLELKDSELLQYLGLNPPIETKSLDDSNLLTELLPSPSEPSSLSSVVPSIFDDDLSSDGLPLFRENNIDAFIKDIVQEGATSNIDRPETLLTEGGVILGHPQEETTRAVSGESAKGSKRGAATGRRSQPARKPPSSSSSVPPSPLTPSTSSASSSSAKSRRRVKKSKAYERVEPYSDMDAEKKRINAINAKKNRDQKKQQYEEMKKNLEDAISERNALLQDLKKMKQHEEMLRTELEKKGIEFPCL